MPETRLYAKLAGTTAVTELVGSRIWPVRRHSDTLPAITYQRVGTTPVNCSLGTVATEFCRVQVDCWDDDYGDVKTLAAAVRAALSGFSDDSDTPDISMCHLTGEFDLPEPPEPGQNMQIHRVSQEYYLQYSTA